LERILQILELLSEKQYITAKSLAKDLEVSDKTIRNDIKQLKEIGVNYGFSVDSKAGYGYKLIVNNRKCLKIFTDEYSSPKLLITNNNRVEYIIMEILISEKKLSFNDLMDSIYVSTSTMYNVLDEAKHFLKKYSCQIKNSTSGYLIIGHEYNIRRCISDILIRTNLNIYYRFLKNDTAVNNIIEELKSILNKHGIHLTEFRSYNFLIYLFVSVYRNQQFKQLPFTRFPALDTHLAVSEVIQELSDYLKNYWQIDFSFIEQVALTYQLIGIKNSSEFEINLSTKSLEEDSDNLTDEIITTIDKKFNTNFGIDKKLISDLRQHLIPMIIRAKFFITIDNPLLETIKSEYAIAFDMARSSRVIFKKKYDRTISDDEISYIALIIQLSLERNRKKYNVAIIYQPSSGIDYILRYKFNEYFNRHIKNLKFYKLSEIDSADFKKIDYIFSTVDLKKTLNLSPILINPVLTSDDITTIYNVFNSN